MDKLDASVNPFTVNEFVVNVRKRTGSGYIRSGKDDKGKDIMIQSMYLSEAEEFAKIYINSAHRQIMAGLSSAARCLLVWLIYELESGKDWIWVNRNRFVKEHGYSDDRTYRNAVEDLMRYGIIAMVGGGMNDVFWINPRFFFFGDRKMKYKKYIKVVRDEDNNKVAEPTETYGGKPIEQPLVVTNDPEEVMTTIVSQQDFDDQIATTMPAHTEEQNTVPIPEEDWFEKMSNLTKGL